MKVLIGVAWPYASGPRHLGHLAGAYLPADIAARYHRLAGDDVLMVSGSDQHGTPITFAAEKANLSTKEFAERQHEGIKSSFLRAGISFDLYTKTSTSNHAQVVQALFLELKNNGFITEGVQSSGWCSREQRSIPDRYIEGVCPHCGADGARGDQCDHCGNTLDPQDLLKPTCKRCGASASFRPLRQLFLRLDLLQPLVADYLASRSSTWRSFVAREAQGWLSSGLKPRAITRDIAWGVDVPVPDWNDRRLYVWFDAVIGYLSASIEWAESDTNSESWQEWWRNDDAHHRYFVGKDNGPFHAVWWPAILLGARQGLHPPDDLVANHYLTLAEEQMSTSRDHGFSVDDGLDRVGTDALRHGLCALNPETSDTEFSWAHLEELTRTGLLGAIANPVHRVTTLLSARFDGRVDPAGWSDAREERSKAQNALREIGASIRRGQFRNALSTVHSLGRSVNQHLAKAEPWHLNDRDAHYALTRLVPLLDGLAVGAFPIVPETASKIRRSLGRPPSPKKWSIEDEPPGPISPQRAL